MKIEGERHAAFPWIWYFPTFFSTNKSPLSAFTDLSRAFLPLSPKTSSGQVCTTCSHFFKKLLRIALFSSSFLIHQHFYLFQSIFYFFSIQMYLYSITQLLHRIQVRTPSYYTPLLLYSSLLYSSIILFYPIIFYHIIFV